MVSKSASGSLIWTISSSVPAAAESVPGGCAAGAAAGGRAAGAAGAAGFCGRGEGGGCCCGCCARAAKAITTGATSTRRRRTKRGVIREKGVRAAQGAGGPKKSQSAGIVNGLVGLRETTFLRKSCPSFCPPRSPRSPEATSASPIFCRLRAGPSSSTLPATVLAILNNSSRRVRVA